MNIRQVVSSLSLIIIALVFLLTLSIALRLNPTLPRCYEDAVLVGAGQFENGQWDNYICGPSFDDYTQ